MKKYLDENGLEKVADYVNKKEPLHFTGTTAEWEELTTEQKKAYEKADITDDESENQKQWFADQLELSDYETTSNDFTAEYDGFVVADAVTDGSGNAGTVKIYVNGNVIAGSNGYVGTYKVRFGCAIAVKKGDTVSVQPNVHVTIETHVAYYKKRDYSLR